MLATVDIGGSSVRAAIGHSSGSLRETRLLPMSSEVSPSEVFEFVRATLHELSQGAAIRGVGVGFPGAFAAGRVATAPNLSSSWIGCSLEEELRDCTGLAAAVANDARVATLGEVRFGELVSAADLRHTTLAYVGLGTGIGGGVAVGGDVVMNASVGEFGHLVIERNGPRCECGALGCVEAIAGGAALARRARTLLGGGGAPGLRELLDSRGGSESSINVRLIAEAAGRGDREMQGLLLDAANALGVLCTNLIHTLAPDIIVFGGGWSQLDAPLLDPIRAEVRRRIQVAPLGPLRLERSKLGDRAGLLGGLVLAQTAAEAADA